MTEAEGNIFSFTNPRLVLNPRRYPGLVYNSEDVIIVGEYLTVDTKENSNNEEVELVIDDPSPIKQDLSNSWYTFGDYTDYSRFEPVYDWSLSSESNSEKEDLDDHHVRMNRKRKLTVEGDETAKKKKTERDIEDDKEALDTTRIYQPMEAEPDDSCKNDDILFQTQTPKLVLSNKMKAV